MDQSVTSKVSKLIGWNTPISPITFPSIEEVNSLKEEMNSKDDTLGMLAFSKIFRFHRFLRSAESEQESKIQQLLWDSWLEGKKIFDNKLVKL